MQRCAAAIGERRARRGAERTPSVSSAADVASMEPSYGHHSTAVMAARWYENDVSYCPDAKVRRSQMRSVPSSPPDAIM